MSKCTRAIKILKEENEWLKDYIRRLKQDATKSSSTVRRRKT